MRSLRTPRPLLAAGLLLASTACVAPAGRSATLGPAPAALQTETADELEARCFRGEARACTAAARLLQQGTELVRFELVARKGCELGDSPACLLVRLARDEEARIQRLTPEDQERECQGGAPFACLMGGYSYLDAKRVARDAPRAERLFREGCDLDARTCIGLAAMYERAEYKDVEQAAELYDRACRAGSARGCLGLGVARWNGAGVPADPAAAVRLFQQACERGNAAGCTWAGFAHQRGRGVERDAARAMVLYDRGCQGGNLRGCTGKAGLLLRGDGVARDVERALRIAGYACDRDDAEACYLLGNAYSREAGVPREPTRARDAYEQACKLGLDTACDRLKSTLAGGDAAPPAGGAAAAAGSAAAAGLPASLRDGVRACLDRSATACETVGLAYATGDGVGRDLKLAEHFFQQGCELDVRACFGLGSFYANSAEPKDPARAAPLFQRACAAGEPYGCVGLADLLSEGRGVAADPARAVELYEQACDANLAAGCTSLGVALTNGKGTPRDGPRGLRMLLRGCDGGSTAGCWIAGAELVEGRLVPRDLTRGVALVRKGCDGGRAYGCAYLGDLYSRGDGVPKDAGRAQELWDKACRMGATDACDRRKEKDGGKASPGDDWW